MIQNAETRLDGTTLVVRIPMRFQRRGGRKRIVAPDGSELAPITKPQPEGSLVKALARAHRWQRMLESGEYWTLAELAAAEQISRSYICRLLRLTLLAPDIVERILDGRPTAGLPLFLQPFQRPQMTEPASCSSGHLGVCATLAQRSSPRGAQSLLSGATR
jgi:hypothetical protein